MNFAPYTHAMLAAALMGVFLGIDHKIRKAPGVAILPGVICVAAAFFVLSQPAMRSLYWFMPLQALLWLLSAASVAQWSADRLHPETHPHSAPTLAMACVLGLLCGFEAWTNIGLAAVAVLITLVVNMRQKPHVTAPAGA
jgi:hypothetical protein